MKRIALLLPVFLLWGCLSEEEGGSAAPIAFGTYRASISQKWYDDDPAPRDFVDEQSLLADGSGEGRMYLVRTADSILLCEGSFCWVLEGATLRTCVIGQR